MQPNPNLPASKPTAAMPPEAGDEAALPEARLAHLCEGRARLVFPRHMGNHGFFSRLTAAMEDLAPVTAAVGRPHTGSLILSFEGRPESVIADIEAAGLFKIAADAALNRLGDAIRADAGKLNSGLQFATRGQLSVSDVSFLAFLSVGLVQLARGRIDINAISALWYAVSVLRTSKPQETPD